MKYIKTYEQYSVNEEFLGLGKLWDKVKNYFSSWSDEKAKQAAKAIADKIEGKKDDPKFQAALAKVKEEYNKLTPEQKEELSDKVEEVKDALPEETSVEESIKMTVGKILKALGLSMAFFGIIFSLVSMFIPVVATTIGLSLYTTVTICMVLLLGGAILNPVGQAMIDKEYDKNKI